MSELRDRAYNKYKEDIIWELNNSALLSYVQYQETRVARKKHRIPVPDFNDPRMKNKSKNKILF